MKIQINFNIYTIYGGVDFLNSNPFGTEYIVVASDVNDAYRYRLAYVDKKTFELHSTTDSIFWKPYYKLKKLL